jgi:WD40 repeat protein
MKMNADITQLAKMMRARRAAGVAPYTLLLGSSLLLTPAVRRAVCDSEDWEAFWEMVSHTSPAERRALMHEPLSQLDLQAGYDALAQLVGAGYFNVVLTLNLDDALDNALKTLPASEYRILVHGEVTSPEIVAALDRPTPRIKVVKLRGDVNAYKLPLTPEATFEFPHDLEDAVTRFLRHDTVIVGDLPFDDDVQRCIRGGDGALWVIAAEESSFLERAKRTRKVGKVIAATEFNAFFTALVEALGLGEVEEAAPEMAFVPPEKRINPYRGLEPFEPEHARYFFGRELLTEMLVERLRRERFLAVLGASGSGKSSVVRAGVVPGLEQGKLPDSETWPVRVMKPGQNPQEALSWALADMVSTARSGRAIDYTRLQETRQGIQERLLHEESALHELVAEVVDGRKSPTEPDDRRVVVVIDQFEELFTLCPFEQRQRLIDTLLHAVGQPDGRTTVLLTLRADFVAQCTAYPDLSDLISSHQVWVRAMNDAGLRAAIELPAWAMGMRYEPGLVPLILADVGREPGALPLLEDALWGLFEYCREEDEVIEVRKYREIGGVQGALAKRADDVYATLSGDGQEYTRRILLQLVEMRESWEPTRRQATLDELITAPEERAPVPEKVRDSVDQVVRRLTDARLLTTTWDVETGRRVVDISHEALIRGWPRLRDWLEENREDLLTRQRLREAAAEWERGERHESYLYRGTRLAKVLEWRAVHEGERRPEPCPEPRRRVVEGLNELERAFLDASVEVEERAAREEEARRQRELEQAQALAEEQRRRAEEQARAAAALAAERDRAEQQARFARSGQLAAQSQIVLEKYPPRSLLLAIEALNVTMQAGEPRVLAAEDALRQALANSGGRSLGGHQGAVFAIAISPDNRWLVTGSGDNTARLWDLTAPDPAAAPIVLRGHEGYVSAVAISPDNHWLVTGSYDATARLWDLTTPDPAAAPIVLRGHESFIEAVATSPDNRWLVTGSLDNTARLWDLTAEDPAAAPIVLHGHEGSINAVAISPDNHWLVTGSLDNTARLWDLTAEDPAAAPIVLHGHEGSINAVAISPDNHWLVTGSLDNTARLWDLTAEDPAAAPIVLHGHLGYVSAVAISPDNHWLVTGSLDNTARLWDLTVPDPAAAPIVLRGHEGFIRALAISPDNHWLVTGSYDATARLWDLTIPDLAAESIVLRGHEDFIEAVAISSDNHWLVTGSADKTARLWDLTAEDPAAAIVLRGHEGFVLAVTISPDNYWLVTGSLDNTARLWDLTIPDLAAAPIVLRGHEGSINAAAISPDNHWLVTGSGDKTARLWDLTAPNPAVEPIVLRGHEGYISAVAISPDNHWLVTGSGDGTARLWDLTAEDPAAAPVVLRGHQGFIRAVAITPDNHRLVTSGGSTAWLWDLTAEDPAAASIVLRGHEGSVNAIAISSDNHWLVTGSEDYTACLWDLTTKDPAAEPIVLRGHERFVRAVAISPDNRWLVTCGGSTAWLRDLTVEDPAAAPIVLRGYEGFIRAVAISPDNRWLVTSGGNTARLWDLSAEDPATQPIVLRSHEDLITVVAISPDSHWLVTGSADATARLWDLTAEDPAAAPIFLRGHEGYVNAVVISSDNHWLVTSSADNTARLWDLTAPDLSTASIVLRGHKGGISAVAISSDNHWLVTGSYDDTARLWNLRLNELIGLAGRTAGRNLTRAEWEQYFPGQGYRKTYEQWPLEEA